MTPIQKRLMFRAHHMGSNENDILFGAFARDHLSDLTEAQLLQFEALLAENDTDLFDWITAKRPVPDELGSELMTMLIAHVAR
jgi:antitoxin CptB